MKKKICQHEQQTPSERRQRLSKSSDKNEGALIQGYFQRGSSASFSPNKLCLCILLTFSRSKLHVGTAC